MVRVANTRLTETMPNHLKERFALKTKYAQACANVNGSHRSCRNYTHSVFQLVLMMF